MARQKFFPKGNISPMEGHIADYVGHEKKEKSTSFFSVCPICGAIRQKKRWYWDNEVKESKRKEHSEQICPGCEAIKEGWVEGEVLLKNKIINVAPWQLEELIHNLEESSRHDDPKNRIVNIKKAKNFWKIYTASVFLARMIGEELERTYNSKTSFRFSKGDRCISVIWE